MDTADTILDKSLALQADRSRKSTSKDELQKETTVKEQKKSHRHYSGHHTAAHELEHTRLLNTPVYCDDLMDRYLWGIAQNIYAESVKKNLSAQQLATLANVNYSHVFNIMRGNTRIGMASFIKLAYALDISPKDLFPDDLNGRKSNGERFDEITKDMDVASCNMLLKWCIDFAKECRRLRLEKMDS